MLIDINEWARSLIDVRLPEDPVAAVGGQISAQDPQRHERALACRPNIATVSRYPYLEPSHGACRRHDESLGPRG